MLTLLSWPWRSAYAYIIAIVVSSMAMYPLNKPSFLYPFDSTAHAVHFVQLAWWGAWKFMIGSIASHELSYTTKCGSILDQCDFDLLVLAFICIRKERFTLAAITLLPYLASTWAVLRYRHSPACCFAEKLFWIRYMSTFHSVYPILRSLQGYPSLVLYKCLAKCALWTTKTSAYERTTPNARYLPKQLCEHEWSILMNMIW